jgi:hypothetical protein
MFAAAAPVTANDGLPEDFSINLPSFDARLSMGFNYDLLRSLTDVSFTYPVGYFGLNLPLAPGGNLLSRQMVDDIFENQDMFKTPDNFKPTTGAGQNANSTVRVDVPMLGGVGSFAYTQNFRFNFSTAFGGSSVIETVVPIGGDDSDFDGFLALRGALRMPLSVSMGWETMTFGYAYRVNNNDDLIFAVNLHRHLFSMDMRLRADIDLLGHVNIKGTIDPGMGMAPQDIVLPGGDLIDFSSDKCNGSAQGRYRAEAWTPSLGVKWWRLRLDSRFGLNVKAKGSAKGGFVVPQLINLENPRLDDVQKKFTNFGDSLSKLPPEEVLGYVSDFMSDAIPRELDSVYYSIDETMHWNMPQGHTITFDIVRDRLSLSYTKTFGEINLKITDVVRETNHQFTEADSWLSYEVLGVDLGVRIDHILMLHYRGPSFFANVGIAGLEARSDGNYAMRDLDLPKFLRWGDVTMGLPVLSGGFLVGTRLQLQLEANVLPLPALKTGVNYYF